MKQFIPHPSEEMIDIVKTLRYGPAPYNSQHIHLSIEKIR